MRILPILLFSLLASSSYAQQPMGNVHMVDMSGTLPFVLGFYAVTFLSLGLFLLKLVRPKFPTYWLYTTCIVGIVGAAVVTWAFDDVQNKQLPQIENSAVEEEKLEPRMKEELVMRRREVENQRYANFWIIAVPNIVILGLAIFSDFNNHKRDPNKPRGRYD